MTPELNRLKRDARPQSLFWGVLLANSAVLVAAGTILALSPATVSHPVSLGEVVTIVIGALLMVCINALLIRRALAPLERLTGVMQKVDLLKPGTRVERAGSAETVELADAFNRMLDRLEQERRGSARRSLTAQEKERRRLAVELHDEVGQSLTALTLQLARCAAAAPPDLQGELSEGRELARKASEDVRRVVAELRPEALDDLGLPAALAALAGRISDHTGLEIEQRLDPVEDLGLDSELVIYRVAQESLTNVVRHSGSERALLSLCRTAQGTELAVTDWGSGLNGGGMGLGIRGMRERALLVGAKLDLEPTLDGGRGLRVRLHVPAGDVRA